MRKKKRSNDFKSISNHSQNDHIKIGFFLENLFSTECEAKKNHEKVCVSCLLTER